MKDLVTIVPDYQDKLGTMKVTPQDIRDAESAGYAHYMAKMLEFSAAQREENLKIAEIRKLRRGIDPHAQQPSTLAIMARPKEKDEEHWNRPLPPEVIAASKLLYGAVASGDETKIKELVAERPMTEQEQALHEKTRRAPKNEIGQSEKSGTGEEQKKKAEEAFLYSPGIEFKDLSEIDRKRICEPYGDRNPRSNGVARRELQEEPAPIHSLASRFKHWLWKKGFPVDRISKEKLTVEEADK